MKKFGFLLGAGAEIKYGLPSGGKFALDIFRQDTKESRNEFRELLNNIDKSSTYASEWLPSSFFNKRISAFGKPVFQNIIRDTIEQNKNLIIDKLVHFDLFAEQVSAKFNKEHREEIKKILADLKNNNSKEINNIDNENYSVESIIEEISGRQIEGVSLGQELQLNSKFADKNDIFKNHYLSSLFFTYKNKSFFKCNLTERKELNQVLLAILQLFIGALGENLTRDLNDSLITGSDEYSEFLDDFGDVFEINYSAVGLTGLDYILSSNRDNEKCKSAPHCITLFARQILEETFVSIIDYKSLIDSYWRYLYCPKSDWAKFCRICIFLFTVKNYIQKQAQYIKKDSHGYYEQLRTEFENKSFDISKVATTNYNTFIQELLGENLQVAFLNGSTQSWYDPYKNKITECNAIQDKKQDCCNFNATNEECHIKVPLLFTQSGTKPMTSIEMSKKYVDVYNAWADSDAIVIVGFGFGSDDEHINGIVRTLVENDKKDLIVVTLNTLSEKEEKKKISKKLKLSDSRHIHIIAVDENGKVDSDKLWIDEIKEKFCGKSHK